MKIILTETIETLGKVGQVITVKDGYARNYLLPKKFAIIATQTNLKKITEIETKAREKADKRNEELRQMAKKIDTLNAQFTRRADEEGKLFGSVSENDIVTFLAENDITCQKNCVNMEKHLKTLGQFDVEIIFTNEIKANLKIAIDSE